MLLWKSRGRFYERVNRKKRAKIRTRNELLDTNTLKYLPIV